MSLGRSRKKVPGITGNPWTVCILTKMEQRNSWGCFRNALDRVQSIRLMSHFNKEAKAKKKRKLGGPTVYKIVQNQLGVYIDRFLQVLSVYLHPPSSQTKIMDNEQDSGEGASSSSFSKPMEGVFHSHLDERVRPYIDLIDSLRLIGVGEDIALPSIAVIGDQSSGKSSVLEALSGVALPRGSGVVTRCPLQLKLRRIKTEVQWKAVISYRKESIENKTEFCDPLQVEQYVREAQIELAGDGVGICNDLITLEIMSPNVCDLTLIDLPGIARVPLQDQPEDIGEQIKHLIRKVIEKGETINLVVVPCNVDIATTEALRMAQEVDPNGKRTLAILTKPDLVDRGTEKSILDIVRNLVIPLSKGYIIVKCRGQQQIDQKMSLEQANLDEKAFFQNHPFFRCLLQEEKATINCLAMKLTIDLVDHIKAILNELKSREGSSISGFFFAMNTLPRLSEEIKRQLRDSKEELSLYCKTGLSLESQNPKAFLIRLLIEFNDKIIRLASGEGDNENNLFVQLRSEFKKWKDHIDSTKSSFDKVVQAVVNEYDQKFRGRELPGFSNYNVFEAVVQRLVIKLKEPAIERLKVIREIIQKHFSDVARACFPNYPYLLSFSMNSIDTIQSRQEAIVEQRIVEQFEMEQLVYTQDGIYLKTLAETHPTGSEASEDKYSGLDSRSNFPKMLNTYYEIVLQRLADQVPMVIRYFLLKESAQLLCSEMLGLIENVNIAEVLREESDITRCRTITQARIERLTIAHQKLSNFV